MQWFHFSKKSTATTAATPQTAQAQQNRSAQMRWPHLRQQPRLRVDTFGAAPQTLERQTPASAPPSQAPSPLTPFAAQLGGTAARLFASPNGSRSLLGSAYSSTSDLLEDSESGELDSIVSFALSASRLRLDQASEAQRIALQRELFVANCHETSQGRLFLLGERIAISLSVEDMQPLARQAAGLREDMPLCVTFEVSGGCGPGAPRPKVAVSYGHSGISQMHRRSSSNTPDPSFAIGIQLVQAAEKHLARTWATRDDTFWADTCALLDQRLRNAGDTCMLCDETLAYPGIKPTVCDSALCCFQLDNLGIGVDLEEFGSNSGVADFLLLASSAAAAAAPSRPGCLPCLPPGNTGEPMTAAQMAQVLRTLPSADELARGLQPDAGLSRRTSDTMITSEARSILRWILATNRAHLTALHGDACISGLPAAHQFRIYSSTRAHAHAFETLKAAHGSFFAFHGSALHNWHNILRNNLQNLSNTPMMSAGAAYGSGIYLAEHMTTSMAYARTKVASAWTGSRLGNFPIVLALCEVANAPSLLRGRQAGIIVAPDPACVTLRYLFVLDNSTTTFSDVQASALQLQS